MGMMTSSEATRIRNELHNLRQTALATYMGAAYGKDNTAEDYNRTIKFFITFLDKCNNQAMMEYLMPHPLQSHRNTEVCVYGNESSWATQYKEDPLYIRWLKRVTLRRMNCNT